MMRRFLLFVFLLGTAPAVFAQTDSTAAVIHRLYNTLNSKDKAERNKYKSTTGETRQGTLGKTTVYTSTLSVPGMTNPVFTEGGGASRAFSAEIAAASYEEAVKTWENFNKKLHAEFSSSWTFTENNNARELYKTAKLMQDGSLLSPTIRYALERNGNAFRLVLEITY